jgi:hypothetical protein
VTRLAAWRDAIREQAIRRDALAQPGGIATAVIGIFLTVFALTVDFPKAAFGFQSDESTYYSLAHSLAADGDFTYQRQDLVRVWEEFPTGPEGIFLKRGNDVRLAVDGRFPFVRLIRTPDARHDRLYFAKSYIYPLAAAPFVWVFGTNGFLVLHALLVTVSFALAYAFLRASAAPGPAIAMAAAFLFASATPVYFVWLTPELFNFTCSLAGLFCWAYREVVPDPERGGFLRSDRAAWLGAVLIGIATFSKPTNVFVIGPVLALPLLRRQWRQVLAAGGVFAAVVAGLFIVNLLITGDFNYQGGDRNTFYGQLRNGFPFQTPQATFESAGASRTTNRILWEVLFSRAALLDVLPHNLVYVTLGRHTGLVPYFFPGVLACLLFLWGWRRRPLFQWLVAGALAAGVVGLVGYMPFTYSGGGGPVGNRYFLGMYPLMLFLTPALASVRPALVALGIGGLFTAQLVLNPFYTSFHPAEHAKAGPFRVLPVELSLLNDLPVNVTPGKVRQPLAGTPPIQAYFLDDNAYAREGEWFWVRGESRADLILRAPVRLLADGSTQPQRLRHLSIEIRAGDVANEVTVRTGARTATVTLAAQGIATVTARVGSGLPYKPFPDQPTNYVYNLSIASRTGFTPMFSSGQRDSRFLGAFVRIVPVYELQPEP